MKKFEWTLERDQMLIKAYHDGLPLSDICKLIGTSKQTVRSHIFLLNIRRTRILGKASGSLWTQKQDEALITGCKAYVSNDTIARQVGKSVSAVANRAKFLGMSKQRRGSKLNNSQSLFDNVFNARIKRDYVPVIPLAGMKWRDAVIADGCRAVLGDVAGRLTRGCGCKRIVGKPYCEEHYKMYYVEEKDE